jgi:hypothetical protein
MGYCDINVAEIPSQNLCPTIDVQLLLNHRDLQAMRDNSFMTLAIEITDAVIDYRKRVDARAGTPNPGGSETISKQQQPPTETTAGVSTPSATSAGSVPKLTDSQATDAFNMLQDRFNRSHAKKVWYEERTDSYVWIGPMKGRKMSMPRAQFEREIAAPYLKAD